MPFAFVWRLWIALVDATFHMHNAKIIHLDLHLANTFFSLVENDDVKGENVEGDGVEGKMWRRKMSWVNGVSSFKSVILARPYQ